MSIPALEYLRHAFPRAEIELLLRPAYAELLSTYLISRNIQGAVFDSVVQWGRSLQTGRYDAAVVLFDEPGISFALWRARVAVRIGAYSKPRSFLFLTHGRRQRRAAAERNEAEYNLELVRELGLHFDCGGREFSPKAVRFPVDAAAAEQAQKVLGTLGIARGERFFLVHPGMGGSALNYPVSGYLSAIGELERRARVLLSLGPAPQDGVLGQELRRLRSDLGVIEGQSLRCLAEIFRSAAALLAPSTGPLHLAHYVGTATIGIYSPVRTHSPVRWRPWGGEGRSFVLVPDVTCPATRECLGAQCQNYPCMEVMGRRGLPSSLLNGLNGS